jgi:hypothetical protein
MAVPTSTQVSWPAAHRQFLTALPQIDNRVRYHFRYLPTRHRREAIADARAAAWQFWHGLLMRGKDPFAVGPTGLAYNACRYVQRSRRRDAGPSLDLSQERPRRGLRLIRLDREDTGESGRISDAWRECLVPDHRCTPADEAAFRLDFAAWLESLPPRKRNAAELLARGHATGLVARSLGVSASAVSQDRSWLARSWRQFQGETSAPD